MRRLGLVGFSQGRRPGEAELGVCDDQESGPAVRRLGCTPFQGGPAERLFSEPESVLQVEFPGKRDAFANASVRTASDSRLTITAFVSVTCTLVGAHDQTEAARTSAELRKPASSSRSVRRWEAELMTRTVGALAQSTALEWS